MAEESFAAQLRKVALGMAPLENTGAIYATRFEAALSSLKEKGKITDWQATKHESEEDVQGIDYFIEINDQKIPFQITSTNKMARRRRKRIREKELRIPVLYVRDSRKGKEGELKPVGRLEWQIMEAIDEYQEGFPKGTLPSTDQPRRELV